MAKDDYIPSIDEMPVNRKKGLFSRLDALEDSSVFTVSSLIKKEEPEAKEEETYNNESWLSTLSSLGSYKIRSKSPKNLFGEGKKKKKKGKKKDELIDFNKEFEPEVALLNNLLVEQNRFVDSLQAKYDLMNTNKAKERGTGKFTTDLIEGINQARKLSVDLIDKKVSIKKSIADLEFKQRKERGISADGEDMGGYASTFLKNIIANRGEIISPSGAYDIEDVDDNDTFASIMDNVDQGKERSRDVENYMKYENRNVKIYVEMNPDNTNDYEYVAEAEDGEILDDYPLPEKNGLTLNISTMTSTDMYGTKYPTRFRQ